MTGSSAPAAAPQAGPEAPQLAHATAAVRSRVEAARRRLRLQTALTRLLRVGPVWLVALGVWLGLVRSAVLPASLDAVAESLLGLAAVLGLAYALWLRVSQLQVARRLDDAARTGDVLSTALWLAETGRNDGWADVQAERAAATARDLQPAVLLPWPALRPWALLASLGLLAATVNAPLPHRWQQVGPARGVELRWPERPQPFATAADLLGKEGAELLAVDLDMLDEVLPQVSDPATKAWLSDVARLLQDVQQGRLDKQEALQKLAALEASKPGGPDAQLPPAGNDPTGTAPTDVQEAERQRDVAVKNAIAEAAKAAVQAAPKSPEAEAIKKAAESGDLDKLAEAVEKLAGKDMSDAELEKWVKALEKFADKLGDRKVPEKFKALAERIARLQEKRNKEGGLSQSDQRRLQDARRELQQLRKEQGDPEAAKYQVQRLEKQVRHAADELRRSQDDQQRLGKREGGKQGQNGGEAGGDNQKGGKQGASQQEVREAMRQAADELRRQAEGQKSRQAQRVGQSRLRDLREGLSRGQKQSAKGQRKGQSGEDDEQNGQRQAGKQGQQGEEGNEGEQGQDGDDQRRHNSGTRVGKDGEQGESQSGQRQGQQQAQRKGFRLGSGNLSDKSRTEAIREGYGQKRSASGGGEGGNDAGQGKGGPNQGKASDAQTGRDERVRGQEGAGADTKQVFLDTAKKGFSRQGWKDVYGEYSEVAEEMTDKQQLPAGRKRLVRRYFEQIRPRETPKPAKP